MLLLFASLLLQDSPPSPTEARPFATVECRYSEVQEKVYCSVDDVRPWTAATRRRARAYAKRLERNDDLEWSLLTSVERWASFRVILPPEDETVPEPPR
jgi:hypothetical protein